MPVKQLAFVVQVELHCGTGVGLGDGLGLGVGEGLGLGDGVGLGDGLGFGVGVGVAITKEIEQTLVGGTVAAAGLIDGAFGVMVPCLVWYSFMAVKMAIPAKSSVATIIMIVVVCFLRFCI